MRTGDTSWKVWFGPIDIPLDHLTQMSFPRDGGKAVEELTENIKTNGLKDPLWATWQLEDTILNKLRVFRGNQRLQALRTLGWKTAPCLICIKGYHDQKIIKNMLEKINEKKEPTTNKNPQAEKT